MAAKVVSYTYLAISMIPHVHRNGDHLNFLLPTIGPISMQNLMGDAFRN